MKNDRYYIKLCELLAEETAAKGDVPVGSIITKGDEIIAEAIEASKNKNDITCHAELEAIRLAIKKLRQTICRIVLYIQHTSLVLCALMLYDFIK